MKKPKQPDRWEREAKKESMKNYGLMSWFGASNLLRREHQAIVRMVRDNMYVCPDAVLSVKQRGEQKAYRTILAKLKARGK